MRVAIVGAGVIGMTTAVAVKSAFPNFEVKVFADQFSPDTTGDGSAGLWGPYLLGNTPIENLLRWSGVTHCWFEDLWKCGMAMETGISLLPVIRATSNDEGYGDTRWAHLVYGAQKLNENDLQKLNMEHKSDYKEAWFFVTYTCEPVKLLPWLMKKFTSLGGKIEKRKILDLCELSNDGYELIINCSGLGAKELVSDDLMIAIRGQVARVYAPWAMHAYIIDDDNGKYIIPNIDSIVIGGTRQQNDFDCTVRKSDSDNIRNGVSRMLPALKKTKILKEWVGLRPGRSEVRLQPETVKTTSGQEFLVIHNYGHGGSGITLCWGCALDVVKIIRSMQTRIINPKL